jgi:hypothetical protein
MDKLKNHRLLSTTTCLGREDGEETLASMEDMEEIGDIHNH